MRGGWLVIVALLGCGAPPPARPQARDRLPLVVQAPVEQPPPSAVAAPAPPRAPSEERAPGRWVSPSAGVFLEGPVALVAPLDDEAGLLRVVNPSGSDWFCASMSPDRKLLFAHDRQRASLWRDVDSAPLLSAPVPELEVGLFALERAECSVEWSPGNEALLFAGQLWEPKSARISTLEPSCIACAGFSPTGRYLFVTGPPLKVLSTADLRPVLELQDEAWPLFGDQDRLLAFSTTEADPPRGEIWEIASRRRLLVTDRLITDFSPDGRFVNLQPPFTRESHIMELASGRTLAAMSLGWNGCGGGQFWSSDSRFYAELGDEDLHLLDLRHKTHQRVSSLGSESCDTLSNPSGAGVFATSQRLWRVDPLRVVGRLPDAALGAPKFSVDGRFFASRVRGDDPQVAVYGLAPLEDLWGRNLRGDSAWLPDAPVLGLVVPGESNWELASPVERVRLQVRVLRDPAGVPTCLSVVREDDVAERFCPTDADLSEIAEQGFDGREVEGLSSGLALRLLETARRGHLTAPLLPAP